MSIFEESINNLKRHRFMTAVTVISISLILVVFNVLITVNYVTKGYIGELANKINLSVFLTDQVSQKDVQEMTTFINQFPEVTQIQTFTKEDALSRIGEKYPQSIEFLEQFDIPNPLPQSIEVQTKNLESQNEINDALKQSKFNQLILKSELKNQHNETINIVVNNLIKIKKFSFEILLWMIITFIIAGGLIIFNAIRTTLYSRRNEIQIMQFVGATFKRIISPFVIEGMLLGFLAFIINVIIILVISQFFPLQIGESTKLLKSGNFLFIIALQAVIAVSMGVLTSLHVVNKYLNTNELFRE